MNPKTMQPLSAKHPDRGWDRVKICRLLHGKSQMATYFNCSLVVGLFITALMMADECFDGILDLIHASVTTLISDIKHTVLIQI